MKRFQRHPRRLSGSLELERATLELVDVEQVADHSREAIGHLTRLHNRVENLFITIGRKLVSDPIEIGPHRPQWRPQIVHQQRRQ